MIPCAGNGCVEVLSFAVILSPNTATLYRADVPVDGTVEISATITNRGAHHVTEVVQLYIRDRGGSVTRPVKELKGFRRLHLAAGASERVSFTLGRAELTYWNAAARDWVLENAAGQASFKAMRRKHAAHDIDCRDHCRCSGDDLVADFVDGAQVSLEPFTPDDSAGLGVAAVGGPFGGVAERHRRRRAAGRGRGAA